MSRFPGITDEELAQRAENEAANLVQVLGGAESVRAVRHCLIRSTRTRDIAYWELTAQALQRLGVV